MKKFERFIIYPMLFIALFFSFAGDEIQQTTAQQVHDEIIAKNLKIVNDDGKTMIELKTEKPGEDIWNILDFDFGKVIVSGDYENENYKNIANISPSTVSVLRYEDKNAALQTYASRLFASSLSINTSNTSIEMNVNKDHGSNIIVENNSANVTDENIDDYKSYKNYIQIGRNRTSAKDHTGPLYAFNSSISIYNQKINDNLTFLPNYDDLELSIGRDILLKSKDNKKQLYIGSNSAGGGYLSVFNKHEEPVVNISQTQPDKNDQGGDHGGVWIYDKYGEDYRSYSYE